MALNKITEAQLDASGVCSAPDVLSGSAAANKAVFDKMVRSAVVPVVNAAIDTVNAIDAVEATRDTAEAARKTAEDGRVLAETGRVNADSTRTADEAARKTVEGNRVTVEAARVNAEAARVTVEDARVLAENSRVTAEAGRVAVENSRVTAEAAREVAEGGRRDGETARMVCVAYDPATPYVPGNKAVYRGSTYQCKVACTGREPTAEAYWIQIAAKGLDGQGSGDMLAAIYDPAGNRQDIFAWAAEKQHTHTKNNITDFAHTHTAGDITDFPAAVAGKADKRVPVAAGNLAALDAAGNLLDSGKKAGDFTGGSILQLTFDAAFAGRPYTVTAPGESYTGTVPAGLKTEVSIKKCNTTYTVESTTAAGDKLSTNITTDNYFGQYQVSLFNIAATLENNSWGAIRQVSNVGQGANYWKIGDKKAITINGKVGETQFSNLTVYAFILGFHHNAAREGSNRIHFQIGKTAAGVDIALVDSKYGTNITAAGYFSMNVANTNAGGWSGSQMRSTVLGSGSTPTNPTANTLLAALSADLRAAMKQVTKYSDNTGGGTDTASFVTATTESLFLLSEWEYFGARSYANSAEQTYQQQYPYYKAGNSKIKYRHDGTTTAVVVWVRSVFATSAAYFCSVDSDGSANGNAACGSYALSPGFCV